VQHPSSWTPAFFLADEGVAEEEGANHLVPRSFWQWRLSGLVISKGSGKEEARGVEGGGGEGGE
jgi:hypothetical protein